tara:strand:+ start:295 stop:522 length:228 start_codon:yes stop_codon:yes gene_type:complete
MSVHKIKENEKAQDSSFYQSIDLNSDINGIDKRRVNLNDLVSRLKVERKKERKHNLLLSTVAISALAIFGIILTL